MDAERKRLIVDMDTLSRRVACRLQAADVPILTRHCGVESAGSTGA